MADNWSKGDEREDVSTTMNRIVDALIEKMPKTNKAIRAEYAPEAAAEYGVTKDYSPKYAQLQADVLGDQGVQLAKTGRELSAAEQLAAAQTEADIQSGPGNKMVDTAIEQAKRADPEYFAQRGSLAEAIKTALASVGDPNKLSPGEEESVARGLGRTAWNVGSPQQAAKDAMVFGDQLAKRRAEQRNAVSTASNALPALRSGLNTQAIATQRTILPNAGLANYTGIVTPGVEQSNVMAGNLLNSSSQIANTIAAKQMSAQDKLKSSTESFKNIVGGTAGIAGVCWVARAVYGESDVRWLLFRNWLANRAPKWFVSLYTIYGERFAEYVKRYPLLKTVVKYFMDGVIKRNYEFQY